ncbi:hypothetical protein NTGZN8_200005 [Candidatus Nitrotoga fabula]|uniref:Uncharacterized protein n=1 Tax=Candidatus Nitrotoga fabula TaxID=2182327 RepID=A0A916BER6_9PROT|nr:hypothetical protein NTGZN8_200005 [Candidatus Nitrotoga fabula]
MKLLRFLALEKLQAGDSPSLPGYAVI